MTSGEGFPGRRRTKLLTIEIGVDPGFFRIPFKCYHMTNDLIVQYLGFQAKPLVREYTFSVREAGNEREFTLNIANEAFVSHQARYQDAPAICSLRLNAELAAHSNHPADTQFAITAAELDNYRNGRAPKPQSPLTGWKKPQDDF